MILNRNSARVAVVIATLILASAGATIASASPQGVAGQITTTTTLGGPTVTADPPVLPPAPSTDQTTPSTTETPVVTADPPVLPAPPAPPAQPADPLDDQAAFTG